MTSIAFGTPYAETGLVNWLGKWDISLNIRPIREIHPVTLLNLQEFGAGNIRAMVTLNLINSDYFSA